MRKVRQRMLARIVRAKRALAVRAYGWYCRQLIAELGDHTRIDPSVWFEDPEKISIGNRCEIRRGAVLIGRSERDRGIELSDDVHIHQYAHLDAYGGFIHLGIGVRIGHHAVIAGHGGVRFGDYSGVAGLSYVIAADHGFSEANVPHVLQKESRRGIEIGENVWGGAGVIITDGIKIGDNAVIGAGAVVRRNVPPNAVVLGNPAQVAYLFEQE